MFATGKGAFDIKIDHFPRDEDAKYGPPGNLKGFQSPRDIQIGSKTYSTGRATPKELRESYNRFLERRREKLGDRASSLVKKILENEDLKLSQSTFKAGKNKQTQGEGFESPYFQSLLGDLAQKIGMEIQQTDSRTSRMHFDGNSIVIEEKVKPGRQKGRSTPSPNTNNFFQRYPV